MQFQHNEISNNKSLKEPKQKPVQSKNQWIISTKNRGQQQSMWINSLKRY